MSGPGSSSWKNPSAAMQTKYHLTPLPEDFEPTEEEQGLLTMYETISKFEKAAARLKEQKSREKLLAKDAEFQKIKAMKKKNRRNRKPKDADVAGAGNASSEDDSDESSDDDANGSDEEEDNKQELARLRAAKLDALQEEIDEKEKAMAEEDNNTKEENMREKLLEKNEDMDFAPSLKRKKLDTADDQNKSLLTNMMATTTPPHDFSKKLDLKPGKGKIVFPVGDQPWWKPPDGAAHPNEGAFLVELEDFDISKASNGKGSNTIAIKFNAPSDSKRFSINIAGPNNDDFNTVLFHFNPRQRERGGQLVVNAKDKGIWGQAIALPLNQVPLIFGQSSITLQIQINGEGFDIFIEDQHCVRLEHRIELPDKPCSLFLQFPSTDDYGSKYYHWYLSDLLYWCA